MRRLLLFILVGILVLIACGQRANIEEDVVDELRQRIADLESRIAQLESAPPISTQTSTALKTSDLSLVQMSSDSWAVKDASGRYYQDILARQVSIRWKLQAGLEDVEICTYGSGSGSGSITIRAHSGRTFYEVAKVVEGANYALEIKKGKLTGSLMANAQNINDGVLQMCKVATDARGTPQEGDLRWDSVNHKLQVYNGSVWETVTSS